MKVICSNINYVLLPLGNSHHSTLKINIWTSIVELQARKDDGLLYKERTKENNSNDKGTIQCWNCGLDLRHAGQYRG